MKAPTETLEIKSLPEKFEYLVSTKIDGVRCLIKDGKVLSSTLRELPNPKLSLFFTDLLKNKEYVFDGELHAASLPFGELVGIVMSHGKDLPKDLKFHAFDCLTLKEWNNEEKTNEYKDRLKQLKEFAKNYKCISVLKQNKVTNRQELQYLIDQAQEDNQEGVMIRSPSGLYKNGRCSLKQDNIYKYKFWLDYDAKILSAHEMIGIKEGIERELDPTGHKKTVHKKDDLEPKGTFGYFIVQVDIEGNPSMEIGSWKGLTRELRDEIWRNPKSYIGRWIRFKGMSVGIKDVPRIPKEIEFRDAKD